MQIFITKSYTLTAEESYYLARLADILGEITRGKPNSSAALRFLVADWVKEHHPEWQEEYAEIHKRDA